MRKSRYNDVIVPRSEQLYFGWLHAASQIKKMPFCNANSEFVFLEYKLGQASDHFSDVGSAIMCSLFRPLFNVYYSLISLQKFVAVVPSVKTEEIHYNNRAPYVASKYPPAAINNISATC